MIYGYYGLLNLAANSWIVAIIIHNYTMIKARC